MLTHNKAPTVCIIIGICCKTRLNENARKVFVNKSKYPGNFFSHLLSGTTLQRVALIIKILWIFCFALTWNIIIQSGHSFAHITTVEFLCHVENCDLIGMIRIYLRAICNLPNFWLWYLCEMCPWYQPLESIYRSVSQISGVSSVCFRANKPSIKLA